jgi:hypothetical protein
MDSSYPALHKFLLPNTKLEDVMVDMNAFKNHASKPKTGVEQPAGGQPCDSKPDDDQLQSSNTENPSGSESNDKPTIPRRQKRLNERIQHKVSFREKRKQKKETIVRLEKEERLRRIKEETKTQSKTSGFQENDLERIKRIVHGMGQV